MRSINKKNIQQYGQSPKVQTSKSNKPREILTRNSLKTLNRTRNLFFAYMMSKYKTKSQVGPQTDAMGRSLEGIQDIVNEFNDYFTSVFTVENTKELPAPVRIFNGPESSRLTVLNFTVNEVAKKLERLRGDKSGGPDNLNPRLLLNL